jgi:hypothetical protein
MSNAQVSIVMLVALLVLVAFDLWLDRSKAGNTFSSRFRAFGRVWPPSRILISAIIGGLLTHWWWTPQDVVDAGGEACCACPDAGPAPTPAPAPAPSAPG